MTRPAQLPWTEDQAANRLLATDPLALLIGMLLDQQFPMERAFLGPELLRRRLGEELSAERIASHEPGSLEQLFKGPPALHRYPGSMAKRTQELCATIVAEYGGDAEKIWTDALTGEELYRRLRALPGYGEAKAREMGLAAVLPVHSLMGTAGQPIATLLVLSIGVAVTSIPIISRIFHDLGILHTRFASLILGFAVIEDILLWGVLAMTRRLIARSPQRTAKSKDRRRRRSAGTGGMPQSSGAGNSRPLIISCIIPPLSARRSRGQQENRRVYRRRFRCGPGVPL